MISTAILLHKASQLLKEFKQRNRDDVLNMYGEVASNKPLSKFYVHIVSYQTKQILIKCV